MVTTYGSGTTVIPAAVSPKNATADIVSFVPSSVNGLGFQDHNRGGAKIFANSLAANGLASVEAPNIPSGLRGLMLDISTLYDGVTTPTGIEIYSLYSITNGAKYTSDQLIATVSGRIVQSRIYVEYRKDGITNIRFSFINNDNSFPCKALTVIATPYR